MIEKDVAEWLIESMANAAIVAGAATMQVYRSVGPIDVSLKSDKTPLTEADRAAHNIIKESLGSTRIPILSEEGREMRYDERRNWELFWLVDPLDGTHEFIERSDEFTINIALMAENRCMASAVYVPCLKRLYLAARDRGSFVCLDIEPTFDAEYKYADIVAAAHQLPLIKEPRETPVVAISRAHNTPETFTYIDHVREQFPDLAIVEQGSSYKFCMLAEGVVDYYVRTSTTYEWDTAAGELILSEAGGATFALPDGGEMIYNKEELENPWFAARSSISPIE